LGFGFRAESAKRKVIFYGPKNENKNPMKFISPSQLPKSEPSKPLKREPITTGTSPAFFLF